LRRLSPHPELAAAGSFLLCVSPHNFTVVEACLRSWFDHFEIRRNVEIARCEKAMVMDVQNFPDGLFAALAIRFARLLDARRIG
jgi:hypothetical protein